MTTRRPVPKTLVCCALPLGYGPAAKLIVLARALRRRGMECVFVGRGIALELAERERQLFGDVRRATGPGEVSGALLRSTAGVLSVMDREISPLAAQCGRPLFVVDSLLWMRDVLPESWRWAERIWAQNFIGLHQCPLLAGANVRVVGPIVDSTRRPAAEPGSGLVVNLGGCEDVEPDSDLSDRYASFVVEGLLGSPLAGRYGGNIALLAGRRCMAQLRSRYGGRGIDFLSLPHDEARERLARAELVLTAPGLTTTLECFVQGVPTGFLPPQNYSQWCILRSLRAAGLAPAALHWEDLSPGSRLADRLSEPVRNPLVRAAISRWSTDAGALRALGDTLARIVELDWFELAARQRQVFDSLGECGVDSIADELCECLETVHERSLRAAAAG